MTVVDREQLSVDRVGALVGDPDDHHGRLRRQRPDDRSPAGSIAAVVMLFGIGFLTVITAAITSTFVARSRLEQKRADAEAPTAEQFRRLDSRLERIEAALAAPRQERSASDAGPPAAEQFRRLDERLGRIEAALTRPS